MTSPPTPYSRRTPSPTHGLRWPLIMLALLVGALGVVRTGPVAADLPTGLTAVSPARLVDTRRGHATVDRLQEGVGRVAGGSTLAVPVAGRAGVPGDAKSVVLNVAVVGADGDGYVTVFPCGSAVPLASNVNYVRGGVSSNAVLARVGDGGNVCLFSSAGADVVVDVNGYARGTGGSGDPIQGASPATNVVPCGAQGRLAPACGALWGVYTTRGATLTSAVTDLEAKVGRGFDMYLRYHDFSTHLHQGEFPDSHQVALGQRMTLVLAWQARVNSSNTDIRWSEITSGRWDERIDAAARRVKAYGKDLIIAFDPEFDRLGHKGSMSEYAAAYRYIHQKFAAAGVTNVVWAWVPTGYIGAGRDRMTMEGYPGSEYVDWVGFDPYNFFTCNGSGWSSFEQEIAPEYNFFVQQGLGNKPFFLMEYGTAYDPANPARSVAWHKEIPSVLKRYPNIKGLIRFDQGSPTPTCNQSIDNGPGMLDSFRQAGLDPYVNTRNR